MSEKYPKSPFEIRSDLLRLSYEVVQQQQDHLSKLLALQHQTLEQGLDMLQDAEDTIREEGKKQIMAAKDHYDQIADAMVSSAVPTMEMIMENAKKFQQFVNQKQ